MSTQLLEAQEAIRKLSRKQLWQFKNWFDEFINEDWDREMEEDAESGKLGKLAEEAMREYREERPTTL